MKAQPFFRLIFLLLISSHWTPTQGQVAGCKDPAATNYNPSASVNDGKCAYATTLYTPPVKTDPISDTLVESSGLQMAGGFLWSFNDGGGAAAIYRVDTTTGYILQTVNLGGANNKDWEDIAFDGTSFYVGDFGNNANGARMDLKIYKFPLSAIPDYNSNPTVTIPSAQIEVINFTYSDQPQPPVATSSNHTKFDCEAVIVDGGKIHLFTKNWIDLNSVHYTINSLSAGTYTATPVDTLATGYLVTAADKAPGNNVIVLLGYQNSGFRNHFMHLLSDFSDGFYFNGNKRRIDLPSAAAMGQAEGIAFRDDGYGYISNEKIDTTISGFPLKVSQKLRTFNTNSFVPAYVLPVQLQQFTAVKKNGANEISWRFTEAVKDVRLQQSSNGADFVTLQTFTASAGGSFLHHPTAKANCYRLVWKDDNGAERYSNVVCLKNKEATAFSKIVLRSNGELSFDFANAASQSFSFHLLTTDGRLLAQTKKQSLMTGGNNVHFFKSLTRGSVFVLEAVSDSDKTSLLLKAE